MRLENFGVRQWAESQHVATQSHVTGNTLEEEAQILIVVCSPESSDGSI